MVSVNEKVLQKLKNVGDALFLLRLINSTNKLISNNQMKKKAEDTSQVFIDISGNYYEYYNNKIIPTDTIDDGSVLIRAKEEAVKRVSKLIKSDSKDLNKLFKDLRRKKNIKRYEEIFQIIDNNFEINVTMTQLIKIAL